MTELLLSILIGILLSAITVGADALIKHASLQPNFSGILWLIIGAIIYGATAFGWFFVMRKAKLSTLGVIYSVTVVVLLTLVSVFYFKEKINAVEIIGIVMAIASLVILARFG